MTRQAYKLCYADVDQYEKAVLASMLQRQRQRQSELINISLLSTTELQLQEASSIALTTDRSFATEPDAGDTEAARTEASHKSESSRR